MSYQIKEAMKAEFKTAMENGETLEEISDNGGEWVDGYLPIYNAGIIKEWQEMPGDYDNRGHLEMGHGEEIDIVRLMSLDLYLYYTDLFNEAITELEEEAGE